MSMIDSDRLIEWIQDLSWKGRILTVPDIRFICNELSKDKKTASGWISVDDRMPEEKPSMWSPLYGGAKWREGLMWKIESERVLVAIRFPDGTGVVRTGKTADGKWHTDVSPVLEQTVTHWMPMPTMPEADT